MKPPNDRGFAPNVDLCFVGVYLSCFSICPLLPMPSFSPRERYMRLLGEDWGVRSLCVGLHAELSFLLSDVAHLHVLLSPVVPAQEIFV